jgi:hypothetical protein
LLHACNQQGGSFVVAVLRDPNNRVRIGHFADAGLKHSVRCKDKIENDSSRCRKVVQVTFKRVVNDDVSRLHVKTAKVACLLVAT